MKIGLYGGTFDPIHHGHLLLARTAREAFELDRIVFIPAAISPHKLSGSPTAAAIRWEMIQVSIAGEADFFSDDLELQRSGPSYTFDTATIYRERFPGAELVYFIGSDHLPALRTWHRIEELQSIVQFIVLGRGESNETPLYPEVPRRIDISASEIRNRVAKGLSIRYLVTQPVDDLIRRHHLYHNLSH